MTQENKTPQANRFRFRAWHPVAKTMHPVTGLHFFEGREFVEISVDSAEGELQNLPKNDFILMQSTGLLDKKGVEIFDGDVVRHFDCGHDYSPFTSGSMNAVITWCADHLCWEFVGEDGDRHSYATLIFDQEKWSQRHESAMSPYRNGKLVQHLVEIEVIGNIYETPELLSSPHP